VLRLSAGINRFNHPLQMVKG